MSPTRSRWGCRASACTAAMAAADRSRRAPRAEVAFALSARYHREPRSRLGLSVVRFVGRTPVDGWWSRRLMRPDLRRECAGEGPDGLVDLSPKEVAQV